MTGVEETCRERPQLKGLSPSRTDAETAQRGEVTPRPPHQ